MTENSKNNDGIALLCLVVALYGIGFGIMAIPTGLFVGPHILAAAVLHIIIGVGYAFASFGISHSKIGAYWASVMFSFAISLFAVFGVYRSLTRADGGSAVVFALISLYFICLAAVSMRAASALTRSRK